MRIRKAGLDDTNLLIKLRMDYLHEEKGAFTEDEQETLRKKLIEYFQKSIADGSFAAFIAEENGFALSAAFLSIVERPPRTPFSTYLVGTVYNVFTYPEHRRKGIASKVMCALLDYAKARDIASVDLLATRDGRPLYEKLGFMVSSYTSMSMKIV